MESWPRLYELLSDVDFLPAAFHAGEFDVQTYWSAIERHSDYRMAVAYGTGLEGRSLPFTFVHAAGSLLYSSGNLDAALVMQQAFVRDLAGRGEQRALAMALNSLAQSCRFGATSTARSASTGRRRAICREVARAASSGRCSVTRVAS